jgi:hypothetical protein
MCWLLYQQAVADMEGGWKKSTMYMCMYVVVCWLYQQWVLV